MMKAEIWKPIKYYQGLYEVSDKGRVRRLFGAAGYVKIETNGYGSTIVRLVKEGITRKFKVDLLVASSFVPNYHNNYKLHHINLLEADCYASNLMWVTLEEYTKLTRLECFNKVRKRKVLRRYELNGALVAEYNSRSEAIHFLGKETGKEKIKITIKLGETTKSQGYLWEYKEVEV